METTFTYKNHEYRLRKMNAIELLALQSQIDFSDVKSAFKFYNTILEQYEVCIDDSWYRVKQEGKNIFYPADIENDVEAIQTILTHFLSYMQSVFQKSTE